MKFLPTVDEIVNDPTARRVTYEIIKMGVNIVRETTGVTKDEAMKAVTRLIAEILEETK